VALGKFMQLFGIANLLASLNSMCSLTAATCFSRRLFVDHQSKGDFLLSLGFFLSVLALV
jgi:hypothetical protein